MSRRAQLKIIFYLNLATVALLVFYKIYLNFFEHEFESVHTAQVAAIQSRLEGRESFSFAVAGNINNSIGIFERKIIPALNHSDVDFVVSTGNAVRNGGEDKYRAVQGTLGHLRIPYVLAFGENEASNFGAFRFYERFGPYFFSFPAGNARFIFLDSTGETSFSWQLQWLEEQLAAAADKHVFIFMGHPVFRAADEPLFDADDAYLDAPAFRDAFVELVARHDVEAVFAANLPIHDRQRHDGTDYIITGGAGGFVLNDDTSFHHVMRVDVNGDDVAVRLANLDVGQYRIFRTLESLWFFIHSLFYTAYTSFLLLVSIIVLITIKLYTMIFVDRDYYPNFDIDAAPYFDSARRVAMFTNNFFPFIGGVPISIDRLRSGLEAIGRKVLVVAPGYRHRSGPEGCIYRLPSLLAFGANREFRLANIFHFGVGRALREFQPDIVHVHHPMWVGSLGIFWARRLRIPVVYTYHTRLEHYAHFVSLPDPLFRNLISHYLIRSFANKCDAVIVPTWSAEEYMRVIGVKTDIFVQPTGIEYERFRNADPDATRELRARLGIGAEKVLVSVSRLSKEKNIDFMLDAVRQLKRHLDTPFKFVIVGDGNEQARLAARIDELALSDTVILAGAAGPAAMPQYYAMGDVFLFASKSETQGMVLLEAMAAGLPVVAVRSSGIDDLVQNGSNGFKTPEDIEQWCAPIRQLLEDDELRQRMAENARRFAKDYSIEAFTHRIGEVYAYALAKRAKRRDDAASHS